MTIKIFGYYIMELMEQKLKKYREKLNQDNSFEKNNIYIKKINYYIIIIKYNNQRGGQPVISYDIDKQKAAIVLSEYKKQIEIYLNAIKDKLKNYKTKYMINKPNKILFNEKDFDDYKSDIHNIIIDIDKIISILQKQKGITETLEKISEHEKN